MDRLTISPDLLTKLAEDEGDLPPVMSAPSGEQTGVAAPAAISETSFRWEMNQDAMATEKLAEGIRNFHADSLKLERIIEERLV